MSAYRDSYSDDDLADCCDDPADYYGDLADCYDDPADYYGDLADCYDDPADYYGDLADCYDDPADYYDPADHQDDSDEVDDLANYLEGLTVGIEYRRFGYFKCSKCKKTWQSANVFCEYKGDGKFEPKWEQECKDCKVSMLPYNNKQLERGRETRSDVPAHRSDLCERCKSGRLCRS